VFLLPHSHLALLRPSFGKVCVCARVYVCSVQLLSLDSSGLNMLHYTCMFNYHRLVGILLGHRAGASYDALYCRTQC
jgi:hypothetical protein